MNKLLSLVSVLIFTSAIYLTSGCKKDDGPQTVQYIIQVDSIVHADTIKVGEKFEVYFYGPLGYNDCYEFEKFVPGFGPFAMNFTLYGLETISNNCEGNPKYMNGEGVAIQDMTEGEWSIQVNQPEGVQPIMSKVYVRQ
jgi:hypothetical protein